MRRGGRLQEARQLLPLFIPSGTRPETPGSCAANRAGSTRDLRPATDGSRRSTGGEVRRSGTGRTAPAGWRSRTKGRPLAARTPSLFAGAARHAARLNLPFRTFGNHPFTPRRFHVLLNSLFKVLFNFPSRYLFAIGLVAVFSLRWSLPPTLGCTLKQPDSKERPSRGAGADVARAWHPLWAVAPFKRDLDYPAPRGKTVAPERHSARRPVRAAGFGAGIPPCSLAVTKGILVSFFSSAY